MFALNQPQEALLVTKTRPGWNVEVLAGLNRQQLDENRHVFDVPMLFAGLAADAARPLSVDGAEVEQLGAVGRQIQVKAMVLQVIPGAPVIFLPQQVLHLPVVRREMLDAQRRVTLAAIG